MRDLVKRLERLEQASAESHDLPTIFVRFAPSKGAATISYRDRHEPEETLTCGLSESISDFKARAIAHFEPRRLPRCGLLLFIEGDESCAT